MAAHCRGLALNVLAAGPVELVLPSQPLVQTLLIDYVGVMR
jgi:hypothetical protein